MSLKNYIVNVREVHIQPVLIEASSKEDAISRVANGEGEIIDNALEYSCTLNPDKWTIEEHKE
jgi:hypothetical protein